MPERDQLPPNQALAAPGKWPQIGEKPPAASSEPWTIEVTGLVAHPRNYTLGELQERPQVERTIDIHCVTRWSKLGARFCGVTLSEILAECRPLPQARFVSFVARSNRGHSTSLSLADAVDLETLVVLEHEGEPLPSDHGGPVRTVVPKRYFYKSLKWLERIELLAQDHPGYWEAEAGYHNHAEPWAEERYIAGNLSRTEVEKLLTSRDFSGRVLLSLSASARDLRGLEASDAKLRNADLRRTDLRNADFRGANLANAHLEGADLRNANLQRADAEGANFSGADLRGTDLRGSLLFGATIGPEPGAGGEPARIDKTTHIDETALSYLTPWQQAYVRQIDSPRA